MKRVCKIANVLTEIGVEKGSPDVCYIFTYSGTVEVAQC